MFKSTITAAVITAATIFTPVAASAMTVSECAAMGDIIEILADFRDIGFTPNEAYTLLIGTGLESNIANTLLEIVFLYGADLSGRELGNTYMVTCIGEAV